MVSKKDNILVFNISRMMDLLISYVDTFCPFQKLSPHTNYHNDDLQTAWGAFGGVFIQISFRFTSRNEKYKIYIEFQKKILYFNYKGFVSLGSSRLPDLFIKSVLSSYSMKWGEDLSIVYILTLFNLAGGWLKHPQSFLVFDFDLDIFQNL